MKTLETSPVMLLQPDAPRWMNFIGGHPRATIFHHPAWLQVLENCYGFQPFILAWPNADGTLGAGVPLMEVASLVSGRRWVSLPFSDYCSPLWEDQYALENLTENILRTAANEKISTVELRGEYPDSPHLHVYSEHVFHEAELDQDIEAVKGRMHEMHRRNIKTALASGVQIDHGGTDRHVEEFYKLHLSTRREQGVPVQPWKFFKELKHSVFDRELGFVLLAYRDGQCLAAAVFLHWQKTLTYKYGASLKEGLQFRPNNLVMWSAMQWGCQNGFTRFDLGRTSLSNQGLRTYKSRWGARESSLRYASLRPRPGGQRFERLMDLSHVVIQKSPLWVCRLSGEVLYKFFG